MYILIIIPILVAGLIFTPKFIKILNSKSEDKSIYATKIFLNSPREILVDVGEMVKFDEDLITVEPEEVKEKLELTITTKKNVDVNECVYFDDNTLIIREEGYFYFKFSVPKSETNNLTETLVVHAVKDSENASLLKDMAYLNDEVQLSEIVTYKNIFTLKDIITSNNVIKNDNKFLFTICGVVDLKLTLNIDKIIYFYEFNISVIESNNPSTPEQPIEPENPDTTEPNDPNIPNTSETPTEPEEPDIPETPTEPEEIIPDEPDTPTEPAEPEKPDGPTIPPVESTYEIIISNFDSVNIELDFNEDKRYKILYEIKGGVGISQQVFVTIEDETILKYISADEMTIYIKTKALGTTKLTIVSAIDENCKKELIVTVK